MFMVTRSPSAPGALTREEGEFWKAAFLVTLPVVLGGNGNLVDRSAARLAELTAEMAWASLENYRKAAKGDRS